MIQERILKEKGEKFDKKLRRTLEREAVEAQDREMAFQVRCKMEAKKAELKEQLQSFRKAI